MSWKSKVSHIKQKEFSFENHSSEQTHSQHPESRGIGDEERRGLRTDNNTEDDDRKREGQRHLEINENS